MVNVRDALISDAESVNSISSALGYPPVPDLAVREWLPELVASKEHRVWVCEVSGAFAGWLHAFRAVRLGSMPFVEIAGLSVTPSSQRWGVGRSLVEAACNWAESEGITIKVRCNIHRAEAHHFYESVGFTKLKSQVVFQRDL